MKPVGFCTEKDQCQRTAELLAALERIHALGLQAAKRGRLTVAERTMRETAHRALKKATGK